MLPVLLFLLTFLVYLHHLSPSVFAGDVGDFLVAAVVKGVAHPPGYPLFTMLGSLFLALPLNQTPAWKVGLVSAIFSSLAVVLMYMIVYELIRKKMLAILTAFTMAFSYMFWLYAEIAEVFALNNFFFLLLLYLVIRYRNSKKITFLYILAFCTGLAFTQHQIIVLLLPSLTLLVLSSNWRALVRPKVLIACMLFFLLGLLPYLYVVITATHSPTPIRWVSKMTLTNFIHFVLRLDYGWRSDPTYGDIYTRLLTLKIYSLELWQKLSPIVLGLVGFGAVKMLREKKIALFLSLVLGFFLTGPFFIVYNFALPLDDFTQSVLERFYMISSLFLLLLFPFGLLFVVQLMVHLFKKLPISAFKKSFYEKVLLVPFLLIPLLFFLYNYQRTDLHDVWLGDNLGRDILEPLPENSALFLAGDTAVLNTMYMQYGRDVRKDIQIYNLPRVITDESFIEQAKKVLTLNAIRPVDTITVLVMLSSQKTRPIFSNIALESDDAEVDNVLWLPYGLIFKLADEADKKMTLDDFIVKQETIWRKLHIPPNMHDLRPSESNLSILGIPRAYADGYNHVGNYVDSFYHSSEKAKDYYEKALMIDPESDIAFLGIGNYYLKKNECQKAEELFNVVISSKPWFRKGYLLQYQTYDMCFKNKEKAKQIANEYHALFKKPIYEELDKEQKK